MAVYTAVSEADLSAWLLRYSFGALRSLKPISSGIENTNYFLDTDQGSYVLTLFERMPIEDLPFYLNLTAHLAKHGVRVAQPHADRSGALFSVLQGKPACLVARLNGHALEAPSREHCEIVGAELARMHLASASYRSRLTNRRGPGWMLTTSRAVRPYITESQNAMLADEMKAQRVARESRADKLPSGAIHADLFRDNVLFDGENLAGFIDFGFAATDCFVYDLAITVNDWCLAEDNTQLEAGKTQALLHAYQSARALSTLERDAWPMMLRLGALRFWLSRLHDFHLPRPSEIVHAKDPSHFERMLNARRENNSGAL